MEFTTRFELHSQATRLQGRPGEGKADVATGLTPAMGRSPIQEDLDAEPTPQRSSQTPQFPTPEGRGIRCWALPASLAATRGILVSFFSFAY